MNLAEGHLRLLNVRDWDAVFDLAESLSAQLSIEGGYRSMDVLHVATALKQSASVFLRFDQREAKLAHATGLQVLPG